MFNEKPHQEMSVLPRPSNAGFQVPGDTGGLVIGVKLSNIN